MTKSVQDVTTLPKTSTLKRWSKRAVIAAVAVTALGAIYAKTQNSDESDAKTN